MQGLLLGMFAETPLHPGAGQSRSVVDLPVAREAATHYPMIPGSSLKGALKDRAKQHQLENIDEIFGKQDSAGAISVTDARLLLLPIRSLTSHFYWVTCPYLIERFVRDCRMMGCLDSDFEGVLERIRQVQPGTALTSTYVVGKKLFLEELSFTTERDQSAMEQIADRLSELVAHSFVQKRLQEQIILIHDDDFAHFARFGLPVQARNELDDEKKTSKNLWYEETLPPDTLFYTLILARPGYEPWLDRLKKYCQEHTYLQVGGNETIGQGWVKLQVWEGSR